VLVHIRPVSLRFDHSLDPRHGDGLWPVLCPTSVLTCVRQVPRVPLPNAGFGPHWGDAPRLLGGHYSSFRSYGLIRQSQRALLYFGLPPRWRGLCRLSPVPAARWTFPTLSLRIFPWMPDPVPRRYHSVLLPVSSAVSSAFPNRDLGRLPANCPLETTSCGPEISERQIFLYVQASKFVLPPQVVPTAAHIAAGQPGFLRPGRTCFVTSACTGYANRPNSGN